MNRGAGRLGELDVAKRYFPNTPLIQVQIGFGLACALVAYVIRLALDTVAPNISPFSLIYPAVLISTLFGRWPSGLITFVITFLYAWYYVILPVGSFAFAHSGDIPRTIINFVVISLILIFTELSRASVQRAAAERTQEIAARDLLLREIDHRMKNNFAIVASLLELQKRQEPTESAKAALSTAAARVQSFAGAHRAIYDHGGDVESIEMRDYLQTLTDYLVGALFLKDKVALELDADVMPMPRDEAVAIGIVLNELVTNAAKHAFVDGQSGLISIEFRALEKGWRMHVTDNGKGLPPNSQMRGLGSTLIAAFAQKAHAQISSERLEQGARFTLSGSRNGAG
ncbi:MAG: histidine kinase dimerization/phosphoacceptor domain -containing protein [Caulobacterales bacterium]